MVRIVRPCLGLGRREQERDSAIGCRRNTAGTGLGNVLRGSSRAGAMNKAADLVERVDRTARRAQMEDPCVNCEILGSSRPALQMES